MSTRIKLRHNTDTNQGMGRPITHAEMDANLESFYISSSLDENVFTLYTTGSVSHSVDLSGAQGIQGTQGIIGAQGITGIQGITGTQGIQGTIGAQGIQGIAGDAGVGTQGVQGITGAQGTTGTQGIQGIAGDAGTGLQGIQGTQGIAGIGTQGIQGTTGTQGIQGIAGDAGTGLQGVQGIQGTIGAQGIQGIAGDAGTGLQGVQGIQGTIGAQGIQGIAGDAGTGLQGIQGIQGTIGAQGIQGIEGSGTQGIQGITGAGIQGIQGVQGISGASVDTNIYNTDGTLTASRTVNLGNNNLTFDGNTNGGNLTVSVDGGTTSDFFLSGLGQTDQTAVLGWNDSSGRVSFMYTSSITSDNIYTANGTLAADRTVTQDGNFLKFESTGLSSNLKFYLTASGEGSQVNLHAKPLPSLSGNGLYLAYNNNTGQISAWSTSSFVQEPGNPNLTLQFNDNGVFNGSDFYYVSGKNRLTTDNNLYVTASKVNIVDTASALDWGKTFASGRLTYNSGGSLSGSALICLPGNQVASGFTTRPGNFYISNTHQSQPVLFISGSPNPPNSRIGNTGGNDGNSLRQMGLLLDYHQTSAPSFQSNLFVGSINSKNHLYYKFNGRVGINANSNSSTVDFQPLYPLHVSGSQNYGSGNVSIYANQTIVQSSDSRFKTNIETISGSLDKVASIRGVTYNLVSDPTGSRAMGVIAQELLDYIPEVVYEHPDGTYAVSYGNIVGVLIEAIKELKAEVDALKNA